MKFPTGLDPQKVKIPVLKCVVSEIKTLLGGVNSRSEMAEEGAVKPEVRLIKKYPI